MGGLTAHGRRLARIPLPPRLGHLVVEGTRRGAGPRAARIAAVLSERGLGGDGVDLTERLERFERDRTPRARDATALAERWARLARGGEKVEAEAEHSDGLLLALAYPERIAQARGASGEITLASGRGARLEPTDRLAREPWLAVGELGGGDRRDRVLLAAPLSLEEIEAGFAGLIETSTDVELDEAGRVTVRRTRKLGALRLETRRIDRPPPELLRDALVGHVRNVGVASLPWGEAAERLRARVAFMGGQEPELWPDLSDAGLLTGLDDWLTPVLEGRRSLASVPAGDLDAAVRGLIPYDLQRRLDAEAPDRFTAPTGNSAAIDYAAEGGPRVEVRVQELFGLAEHPSVGRQRTPLTLALLSPARRPVQVTKDLPGFWKGSWKAVRSEMKGRYPRHPWPEDPLTAPPTTRAKPRGT